MNNVVVLDAGNSLIKAKSAGRETTYLHGLVRLTEAKYDELVRRSEQGLRRGGKSTELIRVNGVPYAYGEEAEKHGTVVRRARAARYTPDYYGVFAAIAMSHLYRQSGDVVVFGSHPPKDDVFFDQLTQSVMGNWHVELPDGGELWFNVTGATTFDEPLGGLMNVLLASNGREYARSELSSGDTLVIDLGGVTCDLLGVSEGERDFLVTETVEAGIQQVERDFAQSVRAHFADKFQGASDLPVYQLRRAFAEGKINIGGKEYVCGDLAQEASSVLINQIYNVVYGPAGGPGRWQNVVLTGGGSAMMVDRIRADILPEHEAVYMAEENMEEAHLANVRGGMKLWRFYESEEDYA